MIPMSVIEARKYKVLVLNDGTYRSACLLGMTVKEVGADSTRVLHIQSSLLEPGRMRAVEGMCEVHDVPYTVVYQPGFGGVFDLTSRLFTALSYADRLNIPEVVYGASAQNKGAENFDYEMTLTHLRQMRLMIKAARYENGRANFPEPQAPLMLLSPYQILQVARKMGVQLADTFNCSEDGLKECGQCPQCLEWSTINTPKALLEARKHAQLRQTQPSDPTAISPGPVSE